MNWPLFWALALAFGVVISNIMLLKYASKLNMSALKPQQPKQAETNPAVIQRPHATSGQKQNSPD